MNIVSCPLTAFNISEQNMKSDSVRPTEIADDAASLLKQAMEQPGVKETMEIYQAFQKIDVAYQAYIDSLNTPLRIISTSSSTDIPTR